MGKPKKPKIVMPAPVQPAAIPEVAEETSETKIRRLRRQSGWGKTIVTGALGPRRRTWFGPSYGR